MMTFGDNDRVAVWLLCDKMRMPSAVLHLNIHCTQCHISCNCKLQNFTERFRSREN